MISEIRSEIPQYALTMQATIRRNRETINYHIRSIADILQMAGAQDSVDHLEIVVYDGKTLKHSIKWER